MKNIALVCEGPTDQKFLAWLLHGMYGSDVSANPLQPSWDETDTSRLENFGGWENVFAFFDRKEALEEILSTNDHLIIQIDTDVCDRENFSVSMKTNGVDKSVSQLVEDVKQKIVERIGQELFEKHKQSISFAICVHSLECWVLPLYAKNEVDIKAVVSCEDRLYRAFGAKGIKYQKDSNFYHRYCKDIRKADNIKLCCASSESFEIFVSSLPPKAV